MIDGVVPNIFKVASLRAGTQSVGRLLVPNASLALVQDPFSTFAPIDGGIEAHEMPLTFPTPSKPMVRISMPREEASVQFPTRGSSEPRKVRPANFQKWVKKLNRMGDPYDHLANFQQIAIVEKFHDLRALVEGFGLTMEGRALSWFQTLKTTKYSSFTMLA